MLTEKEKEEKEKEEKEEEEKELLDWLAQACLDDPPVSAPISESTEDGDLIDALVDTLIDCTGSGDLEFDRAAIWEQESHPEQLELSLVSTPSPSPSPSPSSLSLSAEEDQEECTGRQRRRRTKRACGSSQDQSELWDASSSDFCNRSGSASGSDGSASSHGPVALEHRKRPKKISIFQMPTTFLYQGFAPMFFGALNSGDTNEMRFILNHFVAPDCLIRWTNHCFDRSRTGSREVMRFYELILDSMPDSVILVRKFREQPARDGLVHCQFKLNCSGTVVNRQNVLSFFNMESFAMSMLLNPDKYSPEQVAQSCLLEEQCLSEKKLFMRHLGRIILSLTVDLNRRKIVAYSLSMKVLSLSFTEIPMVPD